MTFREILHALVWIRENFRKKSLAATAPSATILTKHLSEVPYGFEMYMYKAEWLRFFPGNTVEQLLELPPIIGCALYIMDSESMIYYQRYYSIILLDYISFNIQRYRSGNGILFDFDDSTIDFYRSEKWKRARFEHVELQCLEAVRSLCEIVDGSRFDQKRNPKLDEDLRALCSSILFGQDKPWTQERPKEPPQNKL